MLPRVPIASVLVELDARTGFTDHLVHAGGKVARPAELKRNLLYVIIAEATNMGLSAMAESAACPTTCWLGPPSGTSGPRRWMRRTPRWSTTTTGCRCAGVRGRHPVVVGRAAVPGQGQVDHRPAPVAVFRPRPGHLHIQPCVRPALDVRHEGHRGHRPGERTTCSTGCSATTPICRSSSTLPTPMAPPWRTSHCSTWSASSSRRGSATSARSPSTAPGRAPTSSPATRSPGRC